MSREIKFRCWHGDVMLEGITLNKMLCLAGESKCKNPSDFYGDYMQFTGLKDKNGVDIYEGDIVAFGDDDITEPRVGMYGEVGFVKYSHDDAAFKVELNASGRVVTLAEHLLFSDRHVCRIVIGNIHQNKGLL